MCFGYFKYILYTWPKTIPVHSNSLSNSNDLYPQSTWKYIESVIQNHVYKFLNLCQKYLFNILQLFPAQVSYLAKYRSPAYIFFLR